jgi:hypothetical protein
MHSIAVRKLDTSAHHVLAGRFAREHLTYYVEVGMKGLE